MSRIGLSQKPPAPQRDRDHADREENAPRSFDGQQALQPNKQQIRTQIWVWTPLGKIEIAEAIRRVFQMNNDERARQVVGVVEQRRVPDDPQRQQQQGREQRNE